MKIALILSLVMLLMIAGWYRSTAAPGLEKQTMTVDGRERTFFVHWPSGKEQARDLPLVLVLHGGGGSGESMARFTGFNEKSDAKGFLVIYPNGSGRFETKLLTWNSGNCCAYAMENKIDDVKFLSKLIDKSIKDYHVDSRKVFVTGMSNGGMMTYRAGCELSDKIAAIAPVAGAMNLTCKPSRPLSVHIIHGTADEHVLYYGGTGKKQLDAGRVDQPVSASVSFWVKYDGCSATPSRKEEGHVIEETYSGCKDGTEVKLITIRDEGHTWPGGVKWAPWAEPPTKEISATDRIWEFFETHP